MHANTTYKGVKIAVWNQGGRVVASLVRGDIVEHHTIEHNPIEALHLTAKVAITRAKGLLK